MKILASDFDGSACRNGGVSEADRAAISRWRAAGNQFGIVTGRFYTALDPIFNAGMELDFVVASNGAIIIAPDRRYLDQKLADSGILPASAALARKMGAKGLAISLENTVVELDFSHPQDETDALARKLKHFEQFSVYFHSDEEAGAYLEAQRAAQGAFCNPLQNSANVDVPPAGIDKPAGIRRYLARLDAAPEQVITFGDNYNDIAMLTAFEGFAVSDGKEAVKRAAGRVADSLEELIEKFL